MPLLTLPVVVAGRLIVLAFGLGTIVAVWLAARRLSGDLAGVVASAFVAILPLHVANSRFLTTDVPLTFWCSVAALATVLAARRQVMLLPVAAAGLAVGLAAGTKWNGAIAIIMPAIVVLAEPSKIRGVVTLVGGTGIGLVVATPWVVLDAVGVRSGISFQLAAYDGAAAGVEGGVPLFYLGVATLGGALGLLALAIVGAARRRRDVAVVSLAVFVLVYLVIVALPNLRFERNLLPIVPPLAILAGVGAGWLMTRRVRPLAPAVIVIALAWPAGVTIAQTTAITQLDSRTAALDWLDAHVPTDTVIVREQYTPQVDPNRYRVGTLPALWVRPIDWYRAHGVRLLIASDAIDDRFDERYPVERAAYERLRSLPELYRSPPGLNGPVVRIIAIGVP